MTDTPDDLETLARRADADRWLASRFIGDAEQRADVIALYALDQELARVPTVVREPMMAEIRLTWWREAVEGLHAGSGSRGHPVLAALERAIKRRGLTAEPMLAMVDSRFDDIAPEPFADLAAVQAYADGVVGAPLALALAVLGHGDAAALRPAALAWTLARLSRAAPIRLSEAIDTRALGLDALVKARPAIADLPVTAFPAVAHLSLTTPYLKGRAMSDLEKRVRLLAATLIGRF
jgi:phytoene synthase